MLILALSFSLSGACYAAENYICAVGERDSFDLIAEFPEGDSERINLEFEGRTFTAAQVISASGSKYLLLHGDRSQDVMFWSKGESAMLEWDGNKASCHLHRKPGR